LRRIAVPAAAALWLGLFASVIWDAFRRSSEAEQFVDRTCQVLSGAQSLRANLEQAETRQRGDLLTGDPEDLHAYRSAAQGHQRQLLILHQLTSDSPAQQARLREYDRVAKNRLDLLAALTEVYRSQGPAAAAVMVRTSGGKGLMDRLRAILDA